MTQMLFDILNCTTDVLHDEQFCEKGISLSVLRLDKIHATVSGNKLFKLNYFLEEALQSSHKSIVTFGGAYSNHLLATAYVCKTLQLQCTGVVRGEQPPVLSSTLQQCIKYGMQLKFVSRSVYDEKENEAFIARLKSEYGDCIMIPEGGYSIAGANGAALIRVLFDIEHYSHICIASGTATTLAGLLQNAPQGQEVIGVNVLKGESDIRQRIASLTSIQNAANLHLLNDYHFGGYAKKTPALIDFMNSCWSKYTLPLDFVYTAKMMFGVIDQVRNGYFKNGSHILCLHTGGLQGNNSLPCSTLLY